jgi:hypothetical protein
VPPDHRPYTCSIRETTTSVFPINPFDTIKNEEGFFEGRVVVGKMCCNNKMNGLERDKLLNGKGVGVCIFLLQVERRKDFVVK